MMILTLAACLSEPEGRGASSATAAWSATVESAIAAGEYAPQVDGAGFQATNRAQGLRVRFGETGLAVTDRDGAHEVTLGLAAWGREGALVPADGAPPEEGPCLVGAAVDAFGECLRRVDHARAGLVEWWENRPEGLEHGFTVTAPPDGEGALVFELAVAGASVETDGDEALLRRKGAEALRYAGLVAQDEAGRELPGWIEEIEGGLRIVVDDDGAVGTVTVDPLLTTAHWTGEADQASASYGYSVASAGDVNGDGYGDVIVGAYGYDNGSTDEGRAYVFLGSSAGLATTASWTGESDQAYGWFGWSVSSAGDVNGDGYGDVSVGAQGYSNGQSFEGRAYVYLGSSSGLSSSASWTAEADQASARFGSSVASAGDVNGDGYGDLVVGASCYTNGQSFEGRAYVYLGSASGLSTSAAWTAEPNLGDSYFGTWVGSGGDVNGDGYGDVVVGAPYYSNGQTYEGAAYAYLGSSSGLSASASWRVESDQSSALMARSVASAGDVNGDGYGDLVVGSSQYDNGSTDEGRAYVYLGSSSGVATSASWTAEPDQASAQFGASVASAGDVNGDGYGDVVIGAWVYDNGSTDEGRAYVYLGSSSGLATSAAWTTESDQATAYHGAAVASAGDVNGDGFGDVIVGAHAYDNGSTNEGRATVYLGSPSGLGTSAAWGAESNAATMYYAFSVSDAGDVNGDGYGDVVVGCIYCAYSGYFHAGAGYVFHGSSSGLSTSASSTVGVAQANAQGGWSVSGAGDVNGDGYGDLILGVVTYDSSYTNEGRAVVFHGSSSGISTTAAWSANGGQASATAGWAVSEAGDVNGDGYGDVIFGAPSYDNGSTDEGRAWVYLGSSSGLASSAAWTGEADQDYAYYGYSVSSAGDVNGDGYADVAVGARSYDNGESDEGRVWVYHGSSSGLSTTAAWTGESNSGSAWYGLSVSAGGDVNGDGYGDLLVGAPYYTGGGGVFLYLGSASGLASSSAWIGSTGQSGATLGASVSAAGDINGDGYGDVLAGAYNYDNGSTNEGAAFVWLGAASGPSSTAAWSAESNQASAEYALTVSTAGDVNGDGFADVMVGSDLYDNGSTDEGRAFVYYGNAADGTTPLARGAQARRPSGTTPIFPGLTSTSTSSFDVSLATARGAWGRAKVRLQVEAKPLGTAFDGADLQYATTFTSSSTSGVALQQALSGLDAGTGYHWRARVQVTPAEGRPQGWGPWMYGGLPGDTTGGHVFTADGTLYVDADGDGYGDPSVTATGRVRAGYVTNNDDCDDGDAAVHPAASEVCDAADTDEDCDGLLDDDDSGATGQTTFYVDADGDGYGGTTTGSYCDLPSGYVATSTDCDDSAAGVNPGATEVCDASDTDEDCDTLADDADSSATGKSTYYADTDSDGYGGTTSGSYCNLPSGYVATSGDCNDSSAAINPAATEICDAANTDEDCDTLADNADSSATGKTTYYRDADSDGYGGTTSGSYCDLPSGYVATSTDCDDSSGSIHPGATEVCDAADTDEDCDTLADDDDSGATGKSTFYRDADADGYGGTTTGSYCDLPSGYVATSTDCDDSSGSIHPGATEVCDSADTDEDCDTLADDDDSGATGKTTYYRDADSDGYGGTTSASYCDLPSGYVATSTDCNDGSASINPAATEICDAADTDEDCDSLADDDDSGATGKSTFYRDADADGYGGTTSGSYCDLPSGYVATSTDCNDSSAAINPAATEICDAADTDEDCDSLADDDDSGATGKSTFYRDADSDGYGGTTTGSYCDLPGGYVATSTDCDDSASSVHPGATDATGDELDADCSGTESCYVDADADGYRSDDGATVVSPDDDCQDAGEATADALDGDCDDADAAVHPAAHEDVGDAVDANCDGTETCYADADEDGARGTAVVASGDADCADAGEALASAAADCDDADADAFPGATEQTADAVDQDCDGSETCYVDDDGDGYIAGTTDTVASADADCDDAGEAAATALTGDCDDGDYVYNPAAIEDDCTDPNDYNCDGSVAYADTDGDGYAACAECDDTSAAVNPGATEAAGDGVDGDCDGVELCYVDDDDDGYRADTSTVSGSLACDGSGEASASAPLGDCDDADADISPAATDAVGDEVDQDCDGRERCWADADADAFRSDDGAVVTSTDADCDDAGEAASTVTGGDCDDGDDGVNPDATEAVADGLDQDCDGGDTCWADADEDGHADADGASVSSADLACDAPGESDDAAGDDCDDRDATIHPEATEGVGDEVDQDCDDAETCYADADDDGYTDGGTVASADVDCDDAGEATDTTGTGDCDDADAAYNPGATEDDCADPADYNCDGSTGYTDGDGDGWAACEECDDEDAAIRPDAVEGTGDDVDQDCDGAEDCYADADGDGARSSTTVTSSDPDCSDAGEALAAADDDCDDADAAIHPGAAETTGDEVDADCDGAETCLVDADADGYRDEAGTTVASADVDCQGTGEADATTPDGDCDDANGSIHPGATDAAGDALDADCDGAESCYADADEDGARTAFLVASTDTDCSDVGEALSSAALDCDDGDAAAFPGATELVADEVDQDCDGGETCYVDADGDGYVADDSTVTSSDAGCTDAGEAAATALSGDCDDGNAAFNPAAEESACADPNDYNCDGSSGYADTDGDGYAACEECDDGDATVNPDATEVPGDGIDGDCDGVDRCYVDADGDGYRTTDVIDGTTVACDGVGEAADTAGEDCDDGDATISPAATDAVGDEVDQDCDGAERCWADADGDAVRTTDVVDSSDTDCTDAGEAPSSAAEGDCDDTDSTVSPFAAEEVADGVDQDCDGGDTCWADADEDGYAAADGSTVTSPDLACDAPGEAAVAGDDCDDTLATVNPDAEELVGDEVDEDCDGAELCYADADADGYTDGSDVDSLDTDCTDSGELAADQGTGDCDDTDAAYHPDAPETDCADPADYNCDGSSGYTDGDGDGFAACEECDDADAAVNPDAVELAGDGVDQDCDLAEDCYVDADGDGARLEDLVTSTDADCGDAGEALASAELDCDDADAAVSPFAAEVVGDGVDGDCDGLESCYVDADGDGYAPDGGATVESTDADCTDAGEATDTTATGDCDDTSASFHPGAEESDCTDPTDYNCDGSSGYADTDGDGFAACEECDDALGTVNPDADEVCNGVDDDCDGGIDVDATDATTWYADADGDGYTDPDVSTLSCDEPDGYAAATEDDCDDEDPAAFPGADEVPDDSVDQDCDGDDLVTDTDDTGTPTDDTGGETDDTGEGGGGKKTGCGCQTGDAAFSLAGLGLLLIAVSRRRAA